METAIRLEHVTKKYKDFTLNDICLDIPKGCIVGLVGENGAGKTTMIKAILGLINPDAGMIYVNGVPSEKLPKDWKKDVGTVLSGLGFFREGTAETLGRCMKDIYSNWDEERYLHYLEKFKISHDKKIKEYSKGMTVKMVLAVAFSHNAAMLVLDEPTSGLDPVVRDEILDILLEFIQDEEHSVLISSHIVSDLEKTADYIAFLRDGRLEFMSGKDELLEEYAMLRCGKDDWKSIPEKFMQGMRQSAFDCEILIKGKEEFNSRFPQFCLERASVEDIIVYSVRGIRREETV